VSASKSVSEGKNGFMKRIGFALMLVVTLLVNAPVYAKEAAPEPRPQLGTPAIAMDIPRGKGLPVVVQTALFFNGLDSFDDNKGTFEATTDLRLGWHDASLSYKAAPGSRGYREFRAAAAESELAKIWAPNIHFVNRVGEPSLSDRRLRIFPDGRVETLARTTAVYKVAVDVARFPFDHQSLKVEIAVREDTQESVDLDFSSDDVDFSRVANGAELSGWTLGLVNLKREAVKGWDGENYAKVSASLDVQRIATGVIATVFIPLFASLLIPFLATWMNKSEDGGFAVDAFELANVVIGGLFAVIALSFAISSSYPAIASGDNTVTRLIGLNYVALAVGLFIIVIFYRYNIPSRWLGRYVQEQAFRFLIWAFPFLFICTGLAFVLLAAA
jgi:hypothetical protein